MIKRAIGLPMFLIGDFNMTPDTLKESDWLEALKVEVLTTGADSTMNNTIKVNDFALSSPEISHIFQLSLNDPTSFSPHYSILVEVLAHPRAIRGDVLKVPKVLPYERALEKWNTLNENKQMKQWIAAETLARKRLRYSKISTGLAILGKPSDALRNDPKHDLDFLKRRDL